MMGRAEPLVVDVLMAAFAGVRLHEEFAGNLLFAIDLGGTRKESALGAVALAIHIVWRHRRIFYAVTPLPALTDVTRAVANGGQHYNTCSYSQRGRADGWLVRDSLSRSPVQPTRNQQSNADQRNHDMKIEFVPLSTRGPGLDQNHADDAPSSDQQPACARREATCP